MLGWPSQLFENFIIVVRCAASGSCAHLSQDNAELLCTIGVEADSTYHISSVMLCHASEHQHLTALLQSHSSAEAQLA